MNTRYPAPVESERDSDRYTDKERIRDLERRMDTVETAKAMFYGLLMLAVGYLLISGKLAKVFQESPASA